MLLSQLVLLNSILWLTLPDLQGTKSRVSYTGYTTLLLITVETLPWVIQILLSSRHYAMTTTMTSSAVNAKD